MSFAHGTQGAGLLQQFFLGSVFFVLPSAPGLAVARVAAVLQFVAGGPAGGAKRVRVSRERVDAARKRRFLPTAVWRGAVKFGTRVFSVHEADFVFVGADGHDDPGHVNFHAPLLIVIEYNEALVFVLAQNRVCLSALEGVFTVPAKNDKGRHAVSESGEEPRGTVVVFLFAFGGRQQKGGARVFPAQPEDGRFVSPVERIRQDHCARTYPQVAADGECAYPDVHVANGSDCGSVGVQLVNVHRRLGLLAAVGVGSLDSRQEVSAGRPAGKKIVASVALGSGFVGYFG